MKITRFQELRFNFCLPVRHFCHPMFRREARLIDLWYFFENRQIISGKDYLGKIKFLKIDRLV